MLYDDILGSERMKELIFKDFPAFKYWCQVVLPLVYDDSLSLYELMCKVVDYLNKLIAGVNTLNHQVSINTEDIKNLKSELAYIQSELEKIKNGEYADFYIEMLAKWIDNNLQTLVSKIVKYVFFGLSLDGHFIAAIPTSWDFIKFSTITEGPLYGHLVLRW